MKDLKADLFGKPLAISLIVESYLLGFGRSIYRTGLFRFSAAVSAAKPESGA